MGNISTSCLVASNDKEAKSWQVDATQTALGSHIGGGIAVVPGVASTGMWSSSLLLQENVDRWAAISHNAKMAVQAKVLKNTEDLTNAGICDNEKLKDFTYELWKQGEVLQSKLKGRNTNMRTMLDIIQNTPLPKRLSAISHAIAFLDDTAPEKK